MCIISIIAIIRIISIIHLDLFKWQLFLMMMKKIVVSAIPTTKSVSLTAPKHLQHRRSNTNPLDRRFHLLVQCVSVPWRSFGQFPFQTLSVTQLDQIPYEK